jgi:hypothetical protein
MGQMNITFCTCLLTLDWSKLIFAPFKVWSPFYQYLLSNSRYFTVHIDGSIQLSVHQNFTVSCKKNRFQENYCRTSLCAKGNSVPKGTLCQRELCDKGPFRTCPRYSNNFNYDKPQLWLFSLAVIMTSTKFGYLIMGLETEVCQRNIFLCDGFYFSSGRSGTVGKICASFCRRILYHDPFGLVRREEMLRKIFPSLNWKPDSPSRVF